jgi:hypothetical protein
MPSLILEACFSCDTAEFALDEETSVPSPCSVVEPSFATIREAP